MSEHTVISKIQTPQDQANPGPPHGFSAGEALVQPSLNRISIRGRVAQVEPKVMQVLLMMAERPGAVITRASFLDTVWAGTVGDDYLLNRAISELRRILDDDPQSPRYIETIRKGGYRLVAPVAPARVAAALAPAAAAQPDEAEPSADASAEADDAAGASAEPDAATPSPAPPTTAPAGHRRITLAIAATLAVALALVAALTLWPATAPGPAAAYAVQPLTSFVGRELEPAISPDGSRVAFLWDDGGAFDVYVKAIGSAEVLNLSSSPVDERHPLWTPDGRALLFARSGGDGISIMRVSALGGTAIRVFHDPEMRQLRGMSLSPDGRHLVYAARDRSSGPYRLHLAGLEDGSRRALTDPGSGTLGDLDPRFAPDGRSIVFARAVNEVTRDLHSVAVDGGAAQRLTFDNRKINGLAWSPDGARILFTSTRSGLYALWSLAPDGGDPVQVALGNEDVHQPATAPGVDAIAFEQWMHRSRLRQVDLASGAEVDPGRHFRSTRWDSNPAWSPDGRRIAFGSNRGGPHAIWVSAADGDGAVEIASFGGSFIDNPAWSPDGRLIAFDASPDGRTTIYAVAAQGGTPQPLVDGPGDNRNPAWSRDGVWLYFESNRSGGWRVYAQPAGGGEAVAVTPTTGWHARESAEGRFLLYARPDAPGLWQLPRRDWAAGGGPSPETLLVADLDPADAGNWASGDAGVYYVRRPGDAPVLSLHTPADGATVDLLELPPGFEGWGFDLSPDQSRLLYSELTLRESDLRLAQPL
ncbi:MAG TPA: LpqB family beta-propeller domain-containing protein [Luteimonas sp.]|nr:LpqB family beta-propeller domain-containing protein [Luteimonas sp.]